MTRETPTRTRDLNSTSSTLPTGLLQRKCACGQHTIAGEECSDCRKQRLAYYHEAEDLRVNPNLTSDGQGLRHPPLVSSHFSFSIQPKLTVNAPGDAYEHEADAIAEKVMRMPAMGETVQPAYSVCEEEKQLQRKGEGEFEIAPELEQQLKHSAGGGQPLPSQTLSFMNRAFGKDFSAVRVHTGSDAAQMNQMLNAKAFTYGTNIFFGIDKYKPAVTEGKALLAHELTHVVQQQFHGQHLQRAYEETTKGVGIGRQIAAGLLGFQNVAAAACLLGPINANQEITFSRWIPAACKRTSIGYLHSREWDAYGHCWIGCEGSRKCGGPQTLLLGTLHELLRQAGVGGEHDSLKQDIKNQSVGRLLSMQDGTCYTLCDKAHRDKKLDLSAPVRTCIDCKKGGDEGPCPP